MIAVAGQSWVNDLIVRAGGHNPWGGVAARSLPMESGQARDAMPDAVVMSWCGVKEANYRSDVVRGRDGWQDVPAVIHDRIHAVSEAYLGRPGPRLVEGYRRLRALIASAA